MRKFNIKVNGNEYMVEVEEISEGAVSPVMSKLSSPQPQKPAPKVEKEKTESVSAPSSAVSGGIKAPMPGTISDVRINQGQNVKKGDVLIILEAMKMENEIMSPKDGTVKSIHVTKGASVNTADVLVVVE